MTDQLLPTSVRRLREVARERRLDAESAERSLTRAQDRQADAEEEARNAEQGIAPPGFYLTGDNGS